MTTCHSKQERLTNVSSLTFSELSQNGKIANIIFIIVGLINHITITIMSGLLIEVGQGIVRLVQHQTSLTAVTRGVGGEEDYLSQHQFLFFLPLKNSSLNISIAITFIET